MSRCSSGYSALTEVDRAELTLTQDVGLQADWMLSTDLLTDLFFMADILMNFNTGVIVDQVLNAVQKSGVGGHCSGILPADS